MLPGKWPLTLALYIFFPACWRGVFLPRRSCARRARAVRGSPDPARGTTDRSQIRETCGRRFRRGRETCADSPRSQEPGRPAPDHQRRFAAASAALVLLGGGLAAWFSLDTLARTVLEIDYHSQHEHWPEALAAADQLPPGSTTSAATGTSMLALYHTGRLGDEMFRYPQRPGVDLFFTPAEAPGPGDLLPGKPAVPGIGAGESSGKLRLRSPGESAAIMPAIPGQLARSTRSRAGRRRRGCSGTRWPGIRSSAMRRGKCSGVWRRIPSWTTTRGCRACGGTWSERTAGPVENQRRGLLAGAAGEELAESDGVRAAHGALPGDRPSGRGRWPGSRG